MKAILKFSFLVGLALALSMTTFVLGALPMRAARLAYGRLAFWMGFGASSAALAALGLPSYGLTVFALVVIVGVYTDIEEHGGSIFTSALVAVLTAIGTTALCGGLWLHHAKVHLVDEVHTQVATMVDHLTAMNVNASINVDSIMQQLPSMIVIGVIIALALSLIGERRALRWLGVSRRYPEHAASRSSFRVPDVLIWLTIAAIFGAFFRHGNEAIEIFSINALNVFVVIFFFQGLAIVARAFRAFKVAPFWQGLWYIVLVLQLFLLVSLVGFADFWLEFRERLTRKPATTNKGF